MLARNTSVFLAIGALLLLQFSDCMPATPDQQMRHCCGSMTCTPVNHADDCCKTMVTSQTPQVLPTARVLFPPPVVAAIPLQPPDDALHFVTGLRNTVDAQPHPPPELYTLHLALLI